MLSVQVGECDGTAATDTDCTCSKFKAYGIPCRHIMATRQANDQTMCETSLIHQRFKHFQVHNYQLMKCVLNLCAAESSINGANYLTDVICFETLFKLVTFVFS